MSNDIVAVIIGAQSWPRSTAWPASNAFLRSAQGFRDYLLSDKGMRIPSDNLLYLFDDERETSAIDDVIGSFLEERMKNLPALSTLILYYTGHGAFTDGDQKYCIALRCTRIKSLSTSAYRVSSLARTINSHVGEARKYIILDSCYAGAALSDFIPQSSVAERMEANTMDALAETGTALLCASSSSDVALAPKSSNYTMFSGALLESLREGAANKPMTLSFDDLRQMVWSKIVSAYKDEAVNPEIHIPDQRKGDISKVGIFPNRALELPPTDDRILSIERDISAINTKIENLHKTIKNLNVSADVQSPEKSANRIPSNIEPLIQIQLEKMASAVTTSNMILGVSLLFFVYRAFIIALENISLAPGMEIIAFLFSSRTNLFVMISNIFYLALIFVCLVRQTAFGLPVSFASSQGDWNSNKFIIRLISKDYAILPGNIMVVASSFYLSAFLSALACIIEFIQIILGLTKIGP